MIDLIPSPAFDELFATAYDRVASYSEGLTPKQDVELGDAVADAITDEWDLAVGYPATPVTDLMDRYAVDPVVDEDPMTVEDFEKSCARADQIIHWWRVIYPENNGGN